MRRRLATAALMTNSSPNNASILAFSDGVAVTAAGVAVVPTAVAEQGGGSPEGTHVAIPDGDTDAVLVIVAGGAADTVAVTL